MAWASEILILSSRFHAPWLRRLHLLRGISEPGASASGSRTGSVGPGNHGGHPVKRRGVYQKSGFTSAGYETVLGSKQQGHVKTTTAQQKNARTMGLLNVSLISNTNNCTCQYQHCLRHGWQQREGQHPRFNERFHPSLEINYGVGSVQ